MDDNTVRSHSTSIQEIVRKAAPATLIGAVLMLYFGFVQLAQPSGDDLFSRAGLVLYHTLRIGGVAFAVTTLLLFQGWLGALALDAALSLPTGAILIGCGVAMIADGGDGFNSIILILCGGSFVSSGWRNGQEFLRIRGSRSSPFRAEERGGDTHNLS